jgi:hypothetical protein
MKIKQRLPNWMDIHSIERQETEINSIEDLFNVPWIKSWIEDEKFHKLSIDRTEPLFDYPRQYLLMAEMNEGFNWYVIAYLEKDIPELPDWKRKYRNK